MKWPHIQRAVMIKILIAVGILSVLFLPGHIATWVGCCANLVWLFEG